ncbi:hypothetical protein BGX23_003596, partial [Mortierella sp. AD031]
KTARLSSVVAGGTEASASQGNKLFDGPRTDWLVERLKLDSVYLVLQARRDSTYRKTPKARIYERLAADFNKEFPAVDITAEQIKNKISKLKEQFKSTHKTRHSSGFGSTEEKNWREALTAQFGYYWDLEPYWTKSWGNEILRYTDSLANLDDEYVVDNPDPVHDSTEGGDSNESSDLDADERTEANELTSCGAEKDLFSRTAGGSTNTFILQQEQKDQGKGVNCGYY